VSTIPPLRSCLAHKSTEQRLTFPIYSCYKRKILYTSVINEITGEQKCKSYRRLSDKMYIQMTDGVPPPPEQSSLDHRVGQITLSFITHLY